MAGVIACEDICPTLCSDHAPPVQSMQSFVREQRACVCTLLNVAAAASHPDACGTMHMDHSNVVHLHLELRHGIGAA